MIPAGLLGEARKYIVDNLQLDLLLLNGEPVAVELPGESVVVRVKETDTLKVGTASHYKHVTVEGPARIEPVLVELAPHFISPGHRIRLNTPNRAHMQRLGR